MSRTANISALMAFVVTLCTALITLFSQDGVVHFGDVHPVSYMAAVLGAVVAALHTYQARMKPTPSQLGLLVALFFFGALFAMPDAAMAASSSDATASLTWTAPTTRVDGTALSAGEIAEYRVYYAVGADPVLSGTFVSVKTGTTADVPIQLTPGPDPQTINFAVTAVDSAGVESALSSIASKTFLVKSTASPAPPTSVDFSVSCGAGCVISSE